MNHLTRRTIFRKTDLSVCLNKDTMKVFSVDTVHGDGIIELLTVGQLEELADQVKREVEDER